MLLLPRHRGWTRLLISQQMLTLVKLDETHLHMLMSAVNSSPGGLLCAPFARPLRAPSSITLILPLLTLTSCPSRPLLLHKGPPKLWLRLLQGAMLRAAVEEAVVGSSARSCRLRSIASAGASTPARLQ
ncbi:unnamed protein product [Closterium sp. Yama58-4]|nr:unnamed protein product [Closterium sp. Yama58-4]